MSNAFGLPAGTYRVIGAGRFDQLAGTGSPPPAPAYPSAPAQFVLIEGSGSNGATGSWSPPVVSKTEVTGYLVRIMSGETVLESVPLGAGARTYTTTYEAPGSFEFRVAAVNAAGPGDEARFTFVNESEGEQPVPVTLPPAQVTGLVASTPAVGTVRADWTPPATAAGRAAPTGYRVELLQSSLVVTRVEPVEASPHLFTGVAPGTYAVRVTPLSTLGSGTVATSATTTLSATPLAPPLAAGSVSATLTGSTLTVTYTAPAADAARAAVTGYRREFLRGSLVVATQESTALNGSVTLSSDGTYAVRVTPLSTAGPGPAVTSSTVTYTVPVEPETPDTPLPVPAGLPSPRPSTYAEYQFQAGDNTAAVQAFLNTAAGNGTRGVRLVGSGLMAGPVFMPQALQFFRQDADIVITGETQGHFNRAGSMASSSTAISSGWDSGNNVLTLASTSGLAAGDDVVLLADYLFSHKDTNPGCLRKIVRIVGNQVELDLPVYRTVPATLSGASTRRRLHKATLAPPFELQWTGSIRHRDWKGMADGDNFVQQMDTMVFALCNEPYVGSAGAPMKVYQVGGPALKTTMVRGGEMHLDVSFIPDLTRDTASIAHWGYGITCEGGEIGMDVRLRATRVRHAMTTDHNNWLAQSHWDSRNVGLLQTYGETERCKFRYDVFETMSTGVNTHEGGWDNEHTGVIRDTGMWGPLAELKRDPTGLFFRARRDHVGAAGLLVEDVALTAKTWFAAVTVAEASPGAIAPFTLAEGPQVNNLTLRNWNTTRGVYFKQRATLGPNVDIYCKPGAIAFEATAAAAGSRVIGPVRIHGGGKVVGAQYVSGTDAITYV